MDRSGCSIFSDNDWDLLVPEVSEADVWAAVHIEYVLYKNLHESE